MARPGHKPAVLDPVVRAKILTALRTMAPLSVAARCAGLTGRAVELWLQKARTPGTRRVYRTFAAEVEKAEAEAEVFMAGTIAAKARKEWTAAAWLLERKYPERWGRRERFEVSGPGGAPLISDPLRAALADPEIRAALALAAHRMTQRALSEGQGDVIEASAVKIVEGAAAPQEPSNGAGGHVYPEAGQ